MTTRRRDVSDCEGERNGKPQGGQNGSRRANGKGKHGSDREPTKSVRIRTRSPKRSTFLCKRDGLQGPNGEIPCITRTAYVKDGERTCSGVGLAYAKCGTYERRAYSTERDRWPLQIPRAKSEEGR